MYLLCFSGMWQMKPAFFETLLQEVTLLFNEETSFRSVRLPVSLEIQNQISSHDFRF